MRARHVFMSACLGLSLFGIIGQGCGGSTSPTSTPDAGHDSGPPDVGPVDSGSAPESSAPDTSTAMDTAMPACPIEASIENLDVPDAAIPGGDASVGTCLACAKLNCAAQEMQCDMDCACKEALEGLFKCIGGPPSMAEQCALGAIGTEPNAFALGECIVDNCVAACGLADLIGSKDSGPSGMDGTTDSPTEASPTDGPTEAATGEAGD
jgi:hypothetical protein